MADEEPVVDDAQEASEPADETEPFDAGRAKDKIRKANSEAANLRRRLAELEPLAKRAQELEDAQKSESQKLAEVNRSLEERAKHAELDACRMRVALRKGLTETQVKRLLGTTEEELEADADELLAAFKEPETTAPPAGGRPKERLRPGAVPDAEPDPDRAEVLSAIPRI